MSSKRKSSKYIVNSDEEAGYINEEQHDNNDGEEEFEEDEDPKPSKSTSSRSSKKIKRDPDSEEAYESDRSDRGENNDGETYFKLSEKKRVTVREWRNMVLIDFREFFQTKDGNTQPTKKGISLQLEQWNKLKQLIHDIDDEIRKLK
ncbi:13204_t:CDS:2 [Funneliformis caledonium]|uniref:13204_t:CDS:1 n=2 Tax=Funneliformis TaxID=1117308 RepID=A0A9N9C0R2_9GLOM|nr:9445_t:CDS:2 [Funneliformis mosseae]CAG8583601.1 13204_t:CDS:2 [Funneliformis caledonium]